MFYIYTCIAGNKWFLTLNLQTLYICLYTFEKGIHQGRLGN